MKYFNVTPKTEVDDLKKRYRDLSKTMHPDAGGDGLQFIEMHEEFQKALEQVRIGSNSHTERAKADELLHTMVEKILSNPNAIFRIIDLISDKNKLQSFIGEILQETAQGFTQSGINKFNDLLK